MRQAGYANLLPELLLALVGHTGEAFLRRQDGSIALDGAVDWCTPPERCGTAGRRFALAPCLLARPDGCRRSHEHVPAVVCTACKRAFQLQPRPPPPPLPLQPLQPLAWRPTPVNSIATPRSCHPTMPQGAA